MATTKVQESEITLVNAGSPRTGTITLTGVAAGSTIIGLVLQLSSSNRTYTASSDLDGSLSLVVSTGTTQAATIFEKRVATAGTHVVTFTANTGTVNFYAQVVEVSGLHATDSTVTGSLIDAVDANTHYSASSGNIDFSGAGFVLAIGALNSSSGVTSTTAGTGFTKLPGTYPGTNFFTQYKISTGAESDLRGEWTNAGTARGNVGVMAWFPEDTVVPIIQRTPLSRLDLRGGLN